MHLSHWLIFCRFFPWWCFPILDHSLFFWDFDIKMHGNDNKWYLNQFRWFWSLFFINRKQSPGGAWVGKFKKISQKLWFLHYLTRFRGERGIKRSKKPGDCFLFMENELQNHLNSFKYHLLSFSCALMSKSQKNRLWSNVRKHHHGKNRQKISQYVW